MIESIPLPATNDPEDAPFWQGTLRSELLVQQCGDCGRLRFPPRPMCPRCQSAHRLWQRQSGCAHVWSFALPRAPLLPAFERLGPYAVVLASLVEDATIRVVGMWESADFSKLSIGAPVRASFRRQADDVALPCWKPRQESETVRDPVQRSR